MTSLEMIGETFERQGGIAIIEGWNWCFGSSALLCKLAANSPLHICMDMQVWVTSQEA